MRILICSIEMPDPPINGFKLQLAALLREFRRDHEVRLIGFVDRAESGGVHGERREGDRAYVRPSTGLVGKLRDLPVAMATRQPLGVQRLAGRMRSPLAQELVRFQPDVVHVSTTELGLLGPDLRRAGVPSVMVADDAWHLNAHARARAATGAYRRLLQWQESWVRRFESSKLRDFGAVVVVSEGDRNALHGLDPSLSIHAIPNGVDAERFSPAVQWQPEPGLITFTGVMSYPPNVTAA
jgi:glycosyltransferase involved in cell wall biosynthesis